MHAIVAGPEGRLTWQEVPDIAPADDELLIKVASAGINRADLLQAAGNYPRRRAPVTSSVSRFPEP